MTAEQLSLLRPEELAPETALPDGFRYRPGLISALFFAGYGTFRFICEFFREPDTQFIGPVSMGMALSIPVWLGAGALFWIAYRKRQST